MTATTSGGASSRTVLEEVRAATDLLDVGPDGTLVIDGCSAADLVAEHGSPLFVISEGTLRANYRRVRTAFEERWPASVNVMFAIKANNNLAVRAIFHDEGAGGDCFSEGEIHATFAGGADARLIALNGPNKSVGALRQAIEQGMCINLDSRDELDIVLDQARSLRRRARVAIRLRLQSPMFDRGISKGLPDLNGILGRRENGVSLDLAADLVRACLAADDIEAEGYHFHLGRESRDPRVFCSWAAVLGSTVRKLWEVTGFWPGVIDVGGGLPREREPEAMREGLMNPHPVEAYAEAICEPLLEALGNHGEPSPQLWLEPGRYLVGNAGVLLSTVGIVKTDLGRTWVHVDSSINDLPRIDLYGWEYVLLAASRMHDAAVCRANVVGSLCTGAVLAQELRLPRLERGDLIAALDAGMYAEVASTQYNAVPRPATVLVRGGEAELIKHRERVADLFSKHVVPERLRSRSGPWPAS